MNKIALAILIIMSASPVFATQTKLPAMTQRHLDMANIFIDQGEVADIRAIQTCGRVIIEGLNNKSKSKAQSKAWIINIGKVLEFNYKNTKDKSAKGVIDLLRTEYKAMFGNASMKKKTQHFIDLSFYAGLCVGYSAGELLRK